MFLLLAPGASCMSPRPRPRPLSNCISQGHLLTQCGLPSGPPDRSAHKVCRSVIPHLPDFWRTCPDRPSCSFCLLSNVSSSWCLSIMLWYSLY